MCVCVFAEWFLLPPVVCTASVAVVSPLLSHDGVVLLFLQKPGMDVADGYVTFMRHSQDMLRDKVNEEVYIERLFDVSKMPSPPLTKGGAFQNVAKQQGREG